MTSTEYYESERDELAIVLVVWRQEEGRLDMHVREIRWGKGEGIEVR